MDQDILYHLALGSGSHDLHEMFGDVKVRRIFELSILFYISLLNRSAQLLSGCQSFVASISWEGLERVLKVDGFFICLFVARGTYRSTS